MIILSQRTQSIAKHIVAALFCLGFLSVYTFMTCDRLHSQFPGSYPEDDLGALRQLILGPGLNWLCLIAPVFYAAAVYLLTLVAYSSVYETFNSSAIRVLKAAGYCIDLGVTATIWTSLTLLTVSSAFFSFAPETFVLMAVGTTLISLSDNGKTLFRHASKLRNDLDDIV